ncbi:MAG: alcohol dehydrogenase catalytic domain-containing protein [Clostridia bacterium]|nr:alcohol dehydrogenase catalytic domain-containing protein [Clostridia bacterium]
MKAAAIAKTNEMCVLEVPVPTPGDHEVLIRVAYCGICATDYENFCGTTSFARRGELVYPLRFGHEWSGVVCAAGAKVGRLKIGDRVVGDGKVTCGKCANCRAGKWYDCLNLRSVGTVRDHWPGGMAEYICMPEQNVFPIGENVSLKEAAMCEPVAIAMNGLRELSLAGKTVLVIGSGPLGLGGVASARAMGAEKIVCAGRKAVKLQRALQMGATDVINTTEGPLGEQLAALNGGRKADVILETSGCIDYVENVRLYLENMGTLSLIGFYDRLLTNFNLDEFTYSKMTLRGSSGTRENMPVVIRMLNEGSISMMPMLTHEIDFRDIAGAMDFYRSVSAERIKVLVRIAGGDAR